MRDAIQPLLIAGLVVWGMCGPFAWILRDGLGPDSIESEGWNALTRSFWTFYWGPVLILLAAATAMWARYALTVGQAARSRVNREFNARSESEREWMSENTWCGRCDQADLGLNAPQEYEEDGKIFIEGKCKQCGDTIRSEVTEMGAG